MTGYMRNPYLKPLEPFTGEIHFRRFTDHPEMGTGIEIIRADQFCLIDQRMFAEIAHGHHSPWADLDARTGILKLQDDYGHSYVYKCAGWQAVNGVDYIKAAWPD